MKEIPDFNKMYSDAPLEIRDLLNKCANTPQSAVWHPEGDVLKHTRIVYERARKSGDIDLAVAAIFHDLGKVQATKLNKRGDWSAYGHEIISARLVDAHREWIEIIGADPTAVKEIVENHMKIKYIDGMRPPKQEAIRSLKTYGSLLKFSECDNMRNLSDDEMNGIFTE